MTTDAPKTPEPSSFSFGSASEAASELFEALPKSRRAEYLGHLNEIGIVLARAAGLLNVERDSEDWRRPVAALKRPVAFEAAPEQAGP
jgi:hypothetical protein